MTTLKAFSVICCHATPRGLPHPLLVGLHRQSTEHCLLMTSDSVTERHLNSVAKEE